MLGRSHTRIDPRDIPPGPDRFHGARRAGSIGPLSGIVVISSRLRPRLPPQRIRDSALALADRPDLTIRHKSPRLSWLRSDRGLQKKSRR